MIWGNRGGHFKFSKFGCIAFAGEKFVWRADGQTPQLTQVSRPVNCYCILSGWCVCTVCYSVKCCERILWSLNFNELCQVLCVLRNNENQPKANDTKQRDEDRQIKENKILLLGLYSWYGCLFDSRYHLFCCCFFFFSLIAHSVYVTHSASSRFLLVLFAFACRCMPFKTLSTSKDFTRIVEGISCRYKTKQQQKIPKQNEWTQIIPKN